MPTTLDPFYRGDSRAYRVTLRDEDQQPINITGWTITSSMKLSTEQPDKDAPVRVSNVVGEDDGLTGNAYVIFPPEQTKKLIPTIYRIDFQIKSPAGSVTTLLCGEVEVLADVTWGTE